MNAKMRNGNSGLKCVAAISCRANKINKQQHFSNN